MTHNEILRTRLKMATDNGFVIKPHHFMSRDKETGEMYGYESIIFDPDFAKALWGEEHIIDPDATVNGDKMHWTIWKWHLIHMVIAPDRLAYLEANS